MTLTTNQDLWSLAIAIGKTLDAAGNRPIDLNERDFAWFVEQGALDVFIIEHENGVPMSTAKHILRADEGQLVFGVGDTGSSLTTFAKGLPNTKLRRMPSDQLWEHTTPEELADQVDGWITSFSASVARQIEPRPQSHHLLDPGDQVDLQAGHVVSAHPSRLTWARAENAAYLGTEEVDNSGTGLIPLTSDTWLTLVDATSVSGFDSQQLCVDERIAQALDEFHHLILDAEQLNRLLLLADEANEQSARTMHRRIDEERARQELFGVLGGTRATSQIGGSALLATLQMIGNHEGIEFHPPQPSRVSIATEHTMREIANSSGVPFRKVRLQTQDRWWIGDSGAMLGFRKEDDSPVALIPSGYRRYRVVDPVTGESKRIDGEVATSLSDSAWSFQMTLPKDEPVEPKNLIGFVGKGMAGDFIRFAIAGFIASLLILAPPIAIGELIDWVIPSAAGSTLVQMVIALVAITFIATLIHMLRGTAIMRIEARGTARAAAATWDRLLRLPPSFFNRYTAGELATRMAVFQQMRDQISGIVANVLLSVVFLLPTFGLLFYYDSTLASFSLIIAIVSLGLTVTIGMLQIAPIRRRYEVARRLGGELYQFINGMNKLRSAGAEASAFASWARKYRELQHHKIQTARLGEHNIAFSSALPALVAATLFGATLWRGVDEIDLGSFLVVYSAAMLFYAATVRLGYSFESIASIKPGYEQIEPILNALPHGITGGSATIDLSGHIQFDRVSFRYTEDGPMILDDITLEVRPGEFVAIVGESGSGKSTLLRLALGLEDPSSGAVYYDERDLAYLDRRSVRRQIGVVTQDGLLMPGDILDNIIGMGDDLTIEDGWRAADLANVREDIEAMPMGMFTPVSDGSSTFSGGQTQRLRIAAALVRRPRVVFLDEATSWLDARTQSEVMRGIESIAATRVVVAHRLSTIRKAERIYVMQNGRIVQQGTFDELSEIEGPFKELVQRQMT